MIAETPATEILRRVAWSILVAGCFVLVRKLTTLVALCALVTFLIRRLRGRKGWTMPISFAAFVIVLLIPVDVSFRNLLGPPRLIPVLHGMPGPEAFERRERGEVVLGGCEVYPFDADWVLVW